MYNKLMFPLHDRSYKRLFSHPRLFRQLLEHFVDEPWVKELDFEQCEKYDALEQVYQDKPEAKQMLETAIAKEREKIFAQGRAEGKAEGKAQGEVEGWTKGKAEGEVVGRANFLIYMLEMRFEPLTPTQKQHLYELDATRLLKLAEKLWHAKSLQEISSENDG